MPRTLLILLPISASKGVALGIFMIALNPLHVPRKLPSNALLKIMHFLAKNVSPLCQNVTTLQIPVLFSYAPTVLLDVLLMVLAASLLVLLSNVLTTFLSCAMMVSVCKIVNNVISRNRAAPLIDRIVVQTDLVRQVVQAAHPLAMQPDAKMALAKRIVPLKLEVTADAVLSNAVGMAPAHLVPVKLASVTFLPLMVSTLQMLVPYSNLTSVPMVSVPNPLLLVLFFSNPKYLVQMESRFSALMAPMC